MYICIYIYIQLQTLQTFQVFKIGGETEISLWLNLHGSYLDWCENAILGNVELELMTAIFI